MKKFLYLFFILLITLTFSGCFLDAHINSSGSVGMSVGGSVF